jgi:Holliday junction resolvase RusA-like endonuclease
MPGLDLRHPDDHPDAMEHDVALLASEVLVLVQPEHLLRKPKNSKQSGTFKEREAAFKEEARRQLRELRQTKFPEPTPLSLHLDVHVPEGGQQPLMSGVVKAYLDALQGIAYDDDRQIEHLVVHRRGLDHPMMDDFVPDDPGRRTGQVYIAIAPLKAYTRLYDRTFRRLIFARGRDRRSPTSGRCATS